MKKIKKTLFSNYLVNNDGEKTRKLNLRERDDITLEKIINSIYSDKKLKFDEYDSVNVINTYESFKNRIKKTNYISILKGLNKLSFISIGLENEDEPQIIFESLNSTGRDLTTTDLVRNFVLMDSDDQERLYQDYWISIEEGFEDKGKDFDDFIYNYLIIRLNKDIKKSKAYKEFKLYKNNNFDDDVELLIKDIQKYSEYYFRIAYAREEDPELREAFESLNNVKSANCYRFILSMYEDYENNDPDINLSKEDFITIIKTIESYILRRAICNNPYSITPVFFKIRSEIDKKNYLNSFTANLLKYPKNNINKFPSDEEIKNFIMAGNISTIIKEYYNYIKIKTGIKYIDNEDGKKDLLRKRKELYMKIKDIWQYPEKTNEIEELIDAIKSETGIFDERIEDYRYLEEKTQTRNLFDGLTTLIENLDSTLEQKLLRTYILYKINGKNLVKISPLKNQLKIILDINTEDLYDPKKLCENIKEIKSSPSGNTRIYLKDSNDIYPIYEIIKQAYNKIEI